MSVKLKAIQLWIGTEITDKRKHLCKGKGEDHEENLVTACAHVRDDGIDDGSAVCRHDQRRRRRRRQEGHPRKDGPE